MCYHPTLPERPASPHFLPPDQINESVYLYDMETNTIIYNEDHVEIGLRGAYSYRPNGNPGIEGEGGIELVTTEGSKVLRGLVKYRWNRGVVVCVLQLN
jgi:hypothetical protein